VDQAGVVAMPVARPMPRRSTKQKERVRPVKVKRKIFHFVVDSG
jgi:hypothetical protein